MTGVSYTNLGQPLQYTMGTSVKPVYVTDSWDPQTGWLTEQNTQTGTGQASIDDLHYTYDNYGNVTSEADTPAAAPGAADVQCFQNDYLGRLVQAWSQAGDACASTPSTSIEGGAAPYWNSYSYAVTGNLTGIASTLPTGGVTTMSATYPAAGGVQPHAITTQKVTSSTGTTLSSYSYDKAGHLADVSAPSQDDAFTWNDQGQLAQDAVTPAGGAVQATSYVYDAGGGLLLESDPGAVTLYLADEEFTLKAGTVTGIRYYSINGALVAARPGQAGIAYLAGNSQGTDSVAIDAATLNVTRRWYDPYGNPIGAIPGSFPAGQKGFVGGTVSAATDLTNLGAREYQPGLGAFISTDAVLKPYDPQDLDPYAYGYGNPSTVSDPSGNSGPNSGGGGSSDSNLAACENYSSAAQCQLDIQNGPRGCSVTIGVVSLPCSGSVWAILGAYNDTMRNAKPGDLWPGAAGKLQALYSACAKPGLCPWPLVKRLTGAWFHLSAQLVGVLSLMGMTANERVGPSPLDTGRIIAGDIAADEDGATISRALGGCNSFTGDTRVLLSTGKAIPISRVKPGDSVLATDPATGKTSVQPVLATIVTHGDRDFTAIAAKRRHGTVDIVSTAHHPYWDLTTRRWTLASQLRPRDKLYVLGGRTAVVSSVRTYHWLAVTFNLTVAHVHTYYVEAGNTPVLVHNGPPEGCTLIAASDRPTIHSKTIDSGPAKGKQEWRVDIENQGGNAGIHVQFSGPRADETKYYYRPSDGAWVSVTGQVLSTKLASLIPESALLKAFYYLGITP